jgi:hypothetical protein
MSKFQKPSCNGKKDPAASQQSLSAKPRASPPGALSTSLRPGPQTRRQSILCKCNHPYKIPSGPLTTCAQSWTKIPQYSRREVTVSPSHRARVKKKLYTNMRDLTKICYAKCINVIGFSGFLPKVMRIDGQRCRWTLPILLPGQAKESSKVRRFAGGGSDRQTRSTGCG